MAYKRTSIPELMQAAANESFSFRHPVIDTEHLLLAMMKTGGPETLALTKAGANYDNLRKVVLNNSEPGAASQPPTTGSGTVRRILEQAQTIAKQNGIDEMSAEYVLLALLNDRASLVAMMMNVTAIDRKVAYNELIGTIREQKQDEDTSNLSKYGTNLNARAQAGKVDPVIGRSKEINRVIQILARRTKNNPVLIGDPGVGKTAIAEGLAQRIVEGDVPDIMRGKTVYAIDMATMVAGTKYRGDFEQRLNDTIDELIRREDAIVFIDELHTIIGAGGSEGALDASNILKPALAKGELQVIGATTIDEYRQKIEKDAALERRFQPVTVGEPSKAETIEILRGLKKRYEAYHRVMVDDEAILAAVNLTDRYLTDRYLPDKAIDVIDEAMARMRVDGFRESEEVLALEARRERIEEEKTRAALMQDFERAAQLRDELKALGDQMTALKQAAEAASPTLRIGEEDVARIVSQWSNVPITKMNEKENERYLKLAQNLKKRVIGQDYAVDAIASALKRARVGLKAPNRPIGSFIFVGPTGVGKTYLAKSIAEVLFGSESAMIRIDMSEYMEKYSVSRLLGSAPGYVGYDEGGQLTEAVRSNPYSVILFDEIEKAHPDVFNVLLQVLDDGRLTDSKGRTVDFRNTVIILTSNVGATQLEKTNRLGFGVEGRVEEDEYERMKAVVQESLKLTFRPEFLNRLDDVVVFHYLSEQSILQISRLLMKRLMARIDELGYRVSYTDAVAKKLAKDANSAEFGARPLERELRTGIEDLLAEKLLSHEMVKGRAYELRVAKGIIELREREKQEA